MNNIRVVHEQKLRSVLRQLLTRADNAEAELEQATDEGNLWFDLVCAIIEENNDDTLLRRALDTVAQNESA